MQFEQVNGKTEKTINDQRPLEHNFSGLKIDKLSLVLAVEIFAMREDALCFPYIYFLFVFFSIM